MPIVCLITEHIEAFALVVALIMGLTVLFRKSKFWTRALLGVVSIMICASYGVIASIILSLIGKRSIAQYSTGRAFKYVSRALLGIRTEVQNSEILTKVRPAVFISNHQSELDILALGAFFPPHCSVTAKKQLKYTPFLGWFMILSGTVFINRSKQKSAISSLNEAAENMKTDRQSVFLFPEGTRSRFEEPALLPFKKGPFHLAISAQVPIVPIVVENTSHLFNLRRRIFNSGVMRMKVLDPIPTTGLKFEDAADLAMSTRELMLKELTYSFPLQGREPEDGEARDGTTTPLNGPSERDHLPKTPDIRSYQSVDDETTRDLTT